MNPATVRSAVSRSFEDVRSILRLHVAQEEERHLSIGNEPTPEMLPRAA